MQSLSLKVSINLRLPEGRFKIEKATIRNQEIRMIQFLRIFHIIFALFFIF